MHDIAVQPCRLMHLVACQKYLGIDPWYEVVAREHLVDIEGSMEMMVQNDGAEVDVDSVKNFDG